MSSNEAPNNVIQFPGKAKEAEKTPELPQAPQTTAKKKPTPRGKRKGTAANLAGSVLAIILATAAANRYAFDHKSGSFEASSNSEISRGIASVEPVFHTRDANWEKITAEKLARPETRAVASSSGIGHSATPEEKLRWGTLEEKYTIVYKSDIHEIDTIVLQDATTSPSYVLDRNQFLHDYGTLLEKGFVSAKLKSLEMDHDKMIEAYTLFDKDKRPRAEAHFELDSHKRLLSLKVVAPEKI